jgi:hypothetical protein
MAARERFKERVVEAKKIQEQHPDWPMPKYMKEAGSAAK